ncbi:MAG: leader peptidase (prepilin peptidase) / N-methyltransferase [bacterium]|nr:MAG: leader peptidase (prepilin peptidase) / N-methyltransferase [bacterium]
MTFIIEYLIPFIFGTIVGSFLNVCIFRLPKKQSIVSPFSYCPNCHKPIKFYHNIPILSFLFLGGKCSNCREPISYRYPVVELLAGLLSLALFLKFGLSLSYFVYLTFSASLLVITFIDIDHQIIPDVITLPGIILGFTVSLFLPGMTFMDSIIGIAAGGGGLFLVAMGYHLLTKREGMGVGDIKLISMIGAFLGIKGVILTIFLGSLFGSSVGLAVMIKEKRDRRYAVPFGPFLTIGALIFLFWGEIIVRRYLYLG